MYSTRYSIAISLLFLGKLSNTQSVDTSTVTITAAPQFSVEPACVQSCLYWSTGIIQDYLLDNLGCTNSPIYNECYCTQVQDAKASSYLTSCINQVCVGTTLLPNAISLYESYCIGAGYPRNAVATQTPSSSSTKSSATQSSTPTPGNSGSSSSVAANTSPPSSSSSSFSTSQTSSGKTTPSSGSKSKTGPIVGGIIGGLAAVALVIGGIFFYLHSQRKKAGQSQNQGHNPEAAAANPAEQSEKQVAPVVSSEKTAVKERPVSPVSPVSSPVDAAANAKKPAGGRAEPVEKENEPFVNVAQVGAPNVTELQGEGRHGLRPEELDANGQYIGELHGDGRQFTSSELP